MLNDDLKWKAVMLFAAILADDGSAVDKGVIDAALLAIDTAGVRSEVIDALRAAADRIDPVDPVDHCIISEPNTSTPDHPDTRFYDWLVVRRYDQKTDTYIQKIAFEVRMDDNCAPKYSTSLAVWRDHLINHHDQEADSWYVAALRLAHAEWRETLKEGGA